MLRRPQREDRRCIPFCHRKRVLGLGLYIRSFWWPEFWSYPVLIVCGLTAALVWPAVCGACRKSCMSDCRFSLFWNSHTGSDWFRVCLG